MREPTLPEVDAVGDVIPMWPRRRVHHARFGEYEVLAPLARGGMGGVYLAHHEITGERVALKVLDPHLANHPEVVARLYAEHALSSRANHPGLVEIRDARRAADATPYLVMEYLEGQTLGAIAEHAQLDAGAILSIAAQLAAALAALHAAGVIHCDVKHDNVLVTTGARGMRVKLIDFGVSRLADEPLGEDGDPAIAGTPWCMAPEQWEGRPSVASDVYALGCLLYDLFTGAPPFDGSLPELMIAHLEQRPARPSWLARTPMPGRVERLILRALAKHADDRPTMAELAGELAELADAGAPVVLRAAG